MGPKVSLSSRKEVEKYLQHVSEETDLVDPPVTRRAAISIAICVSLYSRPDHKTYQQDRSTKTNVK